MMDLISIQGLPFLSCLVMLSILAYIGLHVLEREVIFIDIALAQIAAVGAIAAHVIFHFHGHSIYANAMALGSTLVAAVFFAVVRRRVTQIPLEAVIGVVYAVSAAGALFLVGVSPGGHVHVQEMLSGSILWVTPGDVAWSAVVFAAVGVCFYLFRRPLQAISSDYENAVEQGYNTLGWDFLFYALVGVVITMAVRVAGVVLVFTFLIIPATLSATVAAGWGKRLLVAWLGGAVSAALGLLFADRFDFSVGPAIALFLGATLIALGLLRLAGVKRAAAGAAWLVAAVVLGAWFASGSTAGDGRPAGPAGGVPEVGSITHTHAEHHDEGEPVEARDEIDAARLAGISDVRELEALYARATDAEERCSVASRALEVDPAAGVRLALGLLEGDPPLLFRMMIVEKVEEVGQVSWDYDIDQPFTAPSNQRAVAGLRESLAGGDGNGQRSSQ
jgi:zinc/manganese transport system permease protein